MKKQIFDLRSNMRTFTHKFYNGWTPQDFMDEYLKIVSHTSTLTKSQRETVIKYVKHHADKNE
jgi:hypothetical protein